MIQSILSFFGFYRPSTRVLEVRAESSWVEDLDNLAEKCQKTKANVIEEAIELYKMAVNTAHFEEDDDGLAMVIPWPKGEQSSTAQEGASDEHF
jgi:hypothetical protein